MLTAAVTGVGLAMDAVAVSVSSGLAVGRASWSQCLRMALAFGVFQAVMPAIGFALGAFLRGWISAVDHWVAFGLLAAIGGKMVWESLGGDEDGPKEQPDPFAWGRLTVLAIATSIDALAVGVGFAALQMDLISTVLIIGAVTVLLCLPAVRLGGILGDRFAHRAELLGGLVLIGIGLKILIEHLIAG
jgi:putative Mn2+ efflux pump MntP